MLNEHHSSAVASSLGLLLQNYPTAPSRVCQGEILSVVPAERGVAQTILVNKTPPFHDQ